MPDSPKILTPEFRLAAGQLLVARKTYEHIGMGQDESVVLLLREYQGCILGVDLTKVESRLNYEDFVEAHPDLHVLEFMPPEDRVVLRGGAADLPINQGKPYKTTILHDANSEPYDAEVIDDAPFIAFTTNDERDAFDAYRHIGPDGGHTRLIIGYTFWNSRKQLQGELGYAWARVQATPELMFKTPRDKLWEKCAAIVGIPLDFPEP